MDAISFVMGEKTQSLRVKRLADLIHGASINRPVANRASVSAIFVNDADGTETIFTRSIIGSSSDHKINNDVFIPRSILKKNYVPGSIKEQRLEAAAEEFFEY